MRSPSTITNHRPSDVHVAITEIGIAILIGVGLAMTAVMTSLEAHSQLLGDWLMQGGAIALGAGIGAALGWWWTRHLRRPTHRYATSRTAQRARPAPSSHSAHHV